MKITIHQKPRKIRIANKVLIPVMKRVCQELSLIDGQIRFVFADDLQIAALHGTYLADDSPTDVITFSLEEDRLDGEIYIGWQMAERQARDYNVTTEQEVLRLMIHGLLHLNGMEDDTNKTRRQMREAEDRLLQIINNEILNMSLN